MDTMIYLARVLTQLVHRVQDGFWTEPSQPKLGYNVLMKTDFAFKKNASRSVPGKLLKVFAYRQGQRHFFLHLDARTQCSFQLQDTCFNFAFHVRILSIISDLYTPWVLEYEAMG